MKKIGNTFSKNDAKIAESVLMFVCLCCFFLQKIVKVGFQKNLRHLFYVEN